MCGNIRIPSCILRLIAIKLFLIVYQASQIEGRCSLTAEQIARETHIFALKSPHYHDDEWSLLRQNFVPIDTDVYLWCSSTDFAVMRCLQNDRFNVTLPFARTCTKSQKEQIRIIPDSKCNSHGAQLYSVGHELDGQFLELYRSCYNKAKVHALYVSHELPHFDVATSTLFTRPDFSTDRIITGNSRTRFMTRNIHTRLNQLLGSQQHYTPNERELVIARGHLAPSGDFVFFDQMRSTFKYINVAPQFASINRSNWKRIENWIRNLANAQFKQRRPPLRIVTGALGVLELQNSKHSHQWVRIYLEDNEKSPIPKWFYKAVQSGQSAGDCTIFLTLNNPYVNGSNVNLSAAEICAKAECPQDIQLVADMTAGYTQCCQVQDFQKRHANLPVC